MRTLGRKNPFAGTWRLLTLEVIDTNGHIDYPMGSEPVGYIIYSEERYVFVVIMHSKRSKFSSETLKEGTADEKAKAADTYVSYCGKYEIQRNTVIHHVEASLFPNWVGTDLIRTFEFKDDGLILLTPPRVVNGIKQFRRLVWKRVSK